MTGSEVSELVARSAVEQLIYRYSEAVTRADYGLMATVFTEDAVWECPPFEWRFESAREFLDFVIEGSTTLVVLIQAPTGPVIELLDDDHATATTNIREILRGTNASDTPLGPAGSEVILTQYGMYFDEVVRLDGAWKFSHRTFMPLLLESGTNAGTLVTSRPVARCV